MLLAAIIVLNTANAQRLAGTLVDFDLSSGETFDYALLSPDGNTFVYVTSRPNRPKSKLYSISSSGGSRAVPLNTGINRVRSVKVSPDNSRVIFITEDFDNVTPTLVSVPIGGGNITRLSAEPFFLPIAASFLRNIKFSPDGRKVLFEHTRRFQEYELFSNDIEGGEISNLNLPAFGLNGSFHSYKISPDSNFVVYSPRTPNGSSAPKLLFRTPIDGMGQPLQLTPSGQSAGSFGPPVFAISPNSQHVVYAAQTGGSGDYQLFSQPSSGGNASGLGSLSASDQFGLTFSITPDSSSVITSTQSTSQANLRDFSRIAIAGGAVLPISSTRSSRATFSRDGQSFYYLSNQGQLYRYSLSSNTSSRVTTKLFATSIGETNDSSHVLFYTNDITEFFSAQIAGQNLQQLNNQLDNGATLLPYKTPEQRNLVAFQSIDTDSEQTATKRDLFLASPITGNTVRVGKGVIPRYEVFDDTIFYLSDEFDGELRWFKADIPRKFGAENNNDLCIPIKGKNSKIAVVCV